MNQRWFGWIAIGLGLIVAFSFGLAVVLIMIGILLVLTLASGRFGDSAAAGAAPYHAPAQ